MRQFSIIVLGIILSTGCSPFSVQEAGSNSDGVTTKSSKYSTMAIPEDKGNRTVVDSDYPGGFLHRLDRDAINEVDARNYALALAKNHREAQPKFDDIKLTNKNELANYDQGFRNSSLKASEQFYFIRMNGSFSLPVVSRDKTMSEKSFAKCSLIIRKKDGWLISETYSN